MLETRVIPCLQLLDGSLVKTVKFDKPSYIGEPLNTCRIFNELEVDEMVVLGIRQTITNQAPAYDLLEKIMQECFMPLAYGGGVKSFEDARKVFSIGYEKVILNTVLFEKEEIVKDIADTYGSQSIIASIDVKKDFLGKLCVYSHDGMKKEKGIEFISWLKNLQEIGVGEILLTDISREGTWNGFDIDLIKKASDLLSIPLIIHGGAGTKKDVEDAVNIGGASAVALGNMVVYQKKDMGVLINYKHDYNFE